MSKNVIVTILVLLVIVAGGWLLLSGNETSPTPNNLNNEIVDENNTQPGNEAPKMEDGTVFCTLDAKICPDGSAVGRVGPDCEFAECPATPPATVAPKTVTVAYTDSGFSPATIVIKNGDTVTFINQSGSQMWVGSDDHPTHADYPAFDQKTSVGTGGSWSFVFSQTGSWGYHNHRRATDRGTVVVNP